MEASGNKRIAKNTLFLYFRKLVTVIIALYSSRLLLQLLGIEDFGLYNIIGSIVLLFASLRGLFASSIQRYLNIAKGSRDSKEINKIFSIGVKIHFLVSLSFLVIAEVGGIIMIHYLNIPEGSVSDAHWILQFSILSTVVAIMTVPYDALIISFEKFSVYAVISVIEYTLKLLIVILLIWSPFSRVVYYSALFLIASLITRGINLIYCKRTFAEIAVYNVYNEPKLVREMSKFAGWQFFGNLGFSFMNSGINFLLNLYGGVAVNAARAIASQVHSTLHQFVTDVNFSFQPQSMVLYSRGEKGSYNSLMNLNTKAGYSICVILSFPMAVFAPSILQIWLGEAPTLASEFIRPLLLYFIIRSIHNPIDYMFKAAGKLNKCQLADCIISTSNILFSWVGLRFGMPYYGVFLIMAFVEGVNLYAFLKLAVKQLGFCIKPYFKAVISRTIFSSVILLVLFFLSLFIVPQQLSVFQTVFGAVVCASIAVICVWYVVFNMTERVKLLSFIRHKS